MRRTRTGAVAAASALTITALLGGSGPAGAAEASEEFVAFEFDRHGLRLFNVSGGDPEALTAAGDSNEPASWLPDGSAFVFRDNGKVARYDLATRSARVLVERPGSAADHPVVSPTGALVAYTSFDAQTQLSEVRVVGTDGQGDRRVFGPSSSSLSLGMQPWSPDGGRIVGWGLFTGPDGRFVDRTIVIDVASGATADVTVPDDAWPLPAWSPRGDVLAVPSETDGVILIAPDSTLIGRLPGRRPNNLLWSPDGTWLAGGAFVGDSITSNGVYVWDTRDAANGARQLFAGGGPDVLNERVTSWSADQSRISFDRVLRSTEASDVATVTLTGAVTVHGKGSYPSFRPAPRGPGGFTDTVGHAHGENVAKVVDAGIASGYPDGTYRPDAAVTRAQMATFLQRAYDLPSGDGPAFADSIGDTHEAGILAVTEAGITSGCRPDAYCPAAPVTRGQMAAFLTRADQLDTEAEGTVFCDTVGHQFEREIRAVAAAGIASGNGGCFRPDDPVTRGQMATFLVRAKGL